jgi:hypothetical protein
VAARAGCGHDAENPAAAGKKPAKRPFSGTAGPLRQSSA